MPKRNILPFLAIIFLLLSATSVAAATRFAVLSDTHLYDPSLGTTGAAFEAYLAQDRKMLRESEAILDSAIAKLLLQRPDFVIISGDLTKDGERKCHKMMARKLAFLRSAGIKVYVCPGNHDVNNPQAYAYAGDTTTPVPRVSPAQFASIYANYGYNQAIDRDSASLSYLAEPVKGLWLLAIDSCKYEDNLTNGYPETGGAIRSETLTWILQKLEDAQTRGKTVIAFMHHGVTEHYTGQSVSFPDYIIDNRASVSKTLADAGLRLVFTGHFHAQDITETVRTDGGPTLVDAETGSLVTYPVPIRTCSLVFGTQATLNTQYITKIDYNTHGTPFPEYARNYLYQGLLNISTYTLIHDYHLSEAVAAVFAPCITNAMVAHYAGDETPSDEAKALAFTLTQSSISTMVFLGQYLGGLWTDLSPADLNATIDLR